MEQRERLYEVLVRYNPNGTVAAHQQRIVEVLDDSGAIIAAKPGEALPLNIEDVAGVLGEVLPAAKAETAAALEVCRQSQQDLKKAQASVEERDEAIRDLSHRLAQAEAGAALLRDQLDATNEALAARNQTIAAMQARHEQTVAGLYEAAKKLSAT
jgi:septal ring factor EnvC (AmiA/AmiB activator)